MAITLRQRRTAVAINENGVVLNAEGTTGTRTNGARSVTVAITNTGLQTITSVVFYIIPTIGGPAVPVAAFGTAIGTIASGAGKPGQVTDLDAQAFYVEAFTGAGATTTATVQIIGSR